MKKAFLFLTASTLLFTACKKDDNNSASRETMVTGKWTVDSLVSGVSYGGQTFLEQNYTKDLQACERDNMIDFVSDHTLYDDEGATTCNSSDPQRTKVGDWKLVNSEQEIALTTTDYMGVPAGTNNMIIDELTSNRMRLHKDSMLSFGGSSATLTIRMYLHK